MSDYESDTTHLSLMEHGAYRLLLDHYYKKQKALPANASLLHRICRAFAPDEQAAVQTVLTEFFVLESDGYHQKRADREIVKVQEISAKRSAAANVRHKGNKDLQAESPTENGSKPPKVSDANAVQVHSKSKFQNDANAMHVDTQLTTHNSQDHNSEEKKEMARTVKPRSPSRVDDEFLSALQAKEPYQKLNVRQVFGKMVAWCEQKQKQPTRMRLINWLNREDQPLSGNGALRYPEHPNAYRPGKVIT